MRGYTLIELMVSIAIFAIVMTLATGAYLELVAVERQAQAVASASNNLSFALDTMTREIRTGSVYSCGATGSRADCAGGLNSFSFRDADSNYVTYGLVGTTIEECVSQIAYCTPATPLIDATISVSALKFYVFGSSRGDTNQPQVTVTASGTVVAGPGKTLPFNVETAATMRGIDL